MTSLLAIAAIASSAGPIPSGSAMIPMTFGDTTLEVFTHKPANYKGDRLIMVFHGTLRNADTYRDHSVNMAERFKAIVVAPRFDSERFPSLRYQRGGIQRADGTAAPKEEWTYAFIPKIAQEVRRRERQPNMPYYLIGHSAGGQFLCRLAAFMNPGAERIVAANPGSALFPTLDQNFGYGYGNLPPVLANEDIIRAYLARPFTLYLGLLDNAPDEYFDMSAAAMLQGGSRLERGVNVFRYARDLAQERGWDFNWRVVFAPEVGHDHGKMFDHPNCEQALFGLSGFRG